ncbi:hypothetical protein ACI6Q2_11375 [Chitinophagaceae bacterium LWZ2-11]
MSFQQWLYNICDNENPDKSIIAYNFGIFETETGYSVYLTGSNHFDKNDPDWATNENFIPKTKYYSLPASDYKDLTWEEILETIRLHLQDFINTEKYKNSFFINAKAITTGFDDGDLIYL